MPRKTKCRHCGEVFSYDRIQDHPYFPFCSERCKLIDLGKWLIEEHKIEEPAIDIEGEEVERVEEEGG